MNSLKLLLFTLCVGLISQAAEIGIPIQLKLKSPGGVYPTESGVNFKVYVLSPATNCILREEDFSSQNVVEGAVSLALGTGSLGSNDPALSLVQVYDNTSAKTGLSCVDANNNVISTGQTYTPAAGDKRIIRVSGVVSSDTVIVNFYMRSVPYAVQADAVGGKTASELLVRNTSSQLNQTNLNNLFLDATRLNNLLNFAISGSVSSAGGFTGSLSGDVSGGQSSTSVDKIKGVPVSSTAPTAGQVLQYNGTQYVPANMASSTVTSVAGRTGAVTLSNSDISGLGSAATLNAGTSAGSLVQLDGTGKIPSALLPASSGTTTLSGDVTGTTSSSVVSFVGGKTSTEVSNAVDDVQGASASSTANAIVKRDGSGNFSANIISSASNSSLNLYLFDAANSIRIRAPSGLGSNLNLVLPGDNGLSGQVLQTDGAGNLTWASVSSAGGTVNSVTASSPLSSSGGVNPNISIAQATASANGYLSSSDWSAFNSKQAALGFTPLNPANNLSDVSSASTARSNLGLGSAASLSVGTTSGTVAAGDDARITGALQSSAYNADVAPAATCTSSQTPYWDTISDSWGCLNISFPAAPVTSVAGRTGAVVLTSSDISGLGTAAVLNVGTSASNVVQLDGSGKIPSSTLPSGLVTSVTASSPLASSGGATPNITISQSNSSTNGYLSSSDWSTFNGKQNALGFTPLNPANNLSDLSSSATGRTNLGLGTAAVLNAGTSASNLVQLDAGSKIPSSTLPNSVVLTSTALAGDVSGTISANLVISVGGKSSSQIATSVSDTTAATASNTASTIVKRDASGSFTAGTVSATTVGAANHYVTSGSNKILLKAAAGLSTDLTLTLPTNNGLSGQVLLTDGAGNLSWSNVSSAGGSVSSVTASAPLSSSGGANPNISLSQATSAANGYLTSSDWSTFNGKQNALGFTPVDVTAYNSDVAPAASCTTSQTAYWNTVSDTWACQSIAFPVTSVAGRTGAVVLSSSDISGLGTAAVLNAGTSASNVVQLDGTARIPASTLPTTAVTTSTAFSGDVTGTVSTISVDRIKAIPVSATTPVTGQAMVYNGTQWAPAYGVPRYSRAAADQTSTTTTLANATNMSFTVAAGSVYKYRFMILFTSGATQTGLRVSVTYPAVTTAGAWVNIAAGGDSTGAFYQGVINSSGDIVTATTTAAASPAVEIATVEGVMVPSAAGTVQLQFASETGTAVVLKAGSFVEYTIVP
jgi:hypothetical protein